MKKILPALLLLCQMTLPSYSQDIILNSVFGENGVFTKSADKKGNVVFENAQAALGLPDGKLLVAVQYGDISLLIRYLPDGTIDRSYGENGYSEPISANVSLIARTSEGKTLVAGTRSTPKVGLIVSLINESGKMDGSFGTKGTKVVPLKNENIKLKDIALQNGKILLAGSFLNSDNQQRALLMRLSLNGDPDGSFGDNGRVEIDVPGITLSNSVSVNGDKILIALSDDRNIYTDHNFTVMQFQQDGTPDTDFGQDGLTSFSANMGDEAFAVVVQKDGKIIVGGGTSVNPYSIPNSLVVARLFSNGKLDLSFNQTGIALADFAASAFLFLGVGIDDRGSITVGVETFNDKYGLSVARFTNDGAIDEKFGQEGKATLDVGQTITNLSKGVLTDDGSFIGMGFQILSPGNNAALDYVLLKIGADGFPAANFGNSGVLTGYIPSKNSYVGVPKLFSDGRLLMQYGASGETQSLGFACLLPDGSTDQNFAESGFLSSRALYFLILPDQRFVTFENKQGIPNDASSLVVMSRYLKNGVLDSSFGQNGQKELLFHKSNYAGSVMLLSNGQLLFLGGYPGAGFFTQTFMVRLDADGNVDKQFGNNGEVAIADGQEDVTIQTLTQSDGKILTTGYHYITQPSYRTQFFIRRFTKDGLLDESFATKGTYYSNNGDNSYAQHILIQPDDKMIINVLTYTGNVLSESIIQRYNQDGRLDSSFGKNGSIDGKNEANVILKEKKLLLASSIESLGGLDAAITLLNEDGSVDRSFGTNGTKSFKFSEQDDLFTDVVFFGNKLFATGLKYKGFDREGFLANFLIQDRSANDTSVSTFTLVNASTNKDIQELKDGDVLDLTKLPRVSLNIRANTTPNNVGSVVLELKGARNYKHTENGAPFSLFGDNKGDYFGSPLPEGDYTLTTTPYSKNNGKGKKGTPLTIHFKVVYPASVTRFVLVNARTGEALSEVKEGSEINLSVLPTKLFSIKAITSPDTVGSVVLNLSGQQIHQQTESILPYSLLGDSIKTYTAWTAEAGSYALVANPYSASKAHGTKGKPYTVHFTVTEQKQPDCTTPSFAPAITTATSLHRAGAAADFNGDGKSDMAINNINGGIITYTGNGEGSFAEGNAYLDGVYEIYNITVGDVNGDGNVDLLVGNHTFDLDHVVSVLRGRGDGTFSEPMSFASGGNIPSRIILVDFNKDGKQDLAVSNSNSRNIGILLGNGDGSFNPAVSYATGLECDDLTSADFNGDGNSDLAFTDFFTGTFGVLLGNGNGSFGQVTTYNSGGFRTYGLKSADFNKDGRQDLAITNFADNTLSVLLGKGEGSFAEPVVYPTGQSFPAEVAVTDLNSDCKLDLVVENWEGQNIVVFMGKGDGSFDQAVAITGIGTNRWLSVADFNADSKPDIAFGFDGVHVLLNTCGINENSVLTKSQQNPAATRAQTMKVNLAAYPNPFTSQSNIRFSVPTSGNTTLSVYNATGAEVETLYQGNADAGKEHNVSLDGKRLPAGIYLLRLSTEKQSTTLKLVLNR